MVNNAKLGLNAGRQFGVEGCGFARMNVGTSRAVVERSMNQLLQAYRELNL